MRVASKDLGLGEMVFLIGDMLSSWPTSSVPRLRRTEARESHLMLRGGAPVTGETKFGFRGVVSRSIGPEDAKKSTLVGRPCTDADNLLTSLLWVSLLLLFRRTGL